MKKLLLLVAALTVSYGSIQAVPSLSDLKKEYFAQYDGDMLDDDLVVINVLARNIDKYLGINSDHQEKILSKDEVADILTQWYRQEPELFGMKVYLNKNKALGSENILDFFMIKSRLKSLISDAERKRYEEIVNILDDLGIKPNLSDDQLHNMVQAVERGEIS